LHSILIENTYPFDIQYILKFDKSISIVLRGIVILSKFNTVLEISILFLSLYKIISFTLPFIDVCNYDITVYTEF